MQENNSSSGESEKHKTAHAHTPVEVNIMYLRLEAGQQYSREEIKAVLMEKIVCST